MDLILVRHAQPVRIDRGGEGPADPQLTELGITQAQRLADWLTPEPIDTLLTSPLRRARQTAEPLSRALGIDAETIDGLAEYDRHAEYYIPIEDLKAESPEEWMTWLEATWADAPESPEDFAARVADECAALVDRFAGQTVVAVCHGGWINAALAWVIGIDRVMWFEPGYTSIHRIRASSKGHRSIASINEAAHLTGRRDST